MNILVTGGAGYIGSHTIVELMRHGHGVVIADNFSNSDPEVVKRLQEITGHDISFYEGDVCDKAFLRKIFDGHDFDAVIHFAGLKAVGESVKKPLLYYRNNIDSSLSLCEVMQEKGVKKLLFSSTATVYSNLADSPLRETDPVGAVTNPYSHTKYTIEQILHSLLVADPSWEITSLRYFNPIGAHESGRIGENPQGIPNNLMPYITQVVVGRLEKLHVFGDDYDTPDGTCIRDYIHVVDLARGHVAALEHMRSDGKMGIYNLGMGKGVSVLEMIHAFERASGKTIPYEIVDRRPGDVDGFYADTTRALRELGWRAEKTIEQACMDSWRWQSQNPNGYKS